MALTLVSIDNNETKFLFPHRGFDAKALLQTVRERELHLSYTEDSLAEALGLEPLAAYERSLRIGEFSDLAGREWFSVSAGLKAIIDQELKFSEEHPGPKFPRYTAELQARFFDGLRSRETFDHWYQTERAENERWSNAEGRLSKDQADCTRRLSYEQFVARYPKLEAEAAADGKDLRELHAALMRRLATPTSTQEFLEEEIAKIPNLASNWVMEMMVKDDALRARVTSELCPTLAAYAGAVSLNRCGATLGVEKGWNPYGWLAPALNDYTDARIIGQAAYAHVLVSTDKGLIRRAKLLQELKLFRPEVMSWAALLARPV